jgi:hypothetical protein
MKKTISILAIAGLVLALTAPTWAATVTWDAGGVADQKWSTAANWTGDVLPGAGDTAVIAGGYSAVLDSSVASITAMEVDGGATLTVKTGAVLMMSGGFTVESGATVLQEDGSITTGGGGTSGGDIHIRSGGIYTIEGGTWQIGGDPHILSDNSGGGTLKIIGFGATINVRDDYKMWNASGQDGTLELVLKGTGISPINVRGYMQLTGILDVSLDPSFVLPTITTDYDFLVNYDEFTVNQQLDSYNLPNETDWSLTYLDGNAGVRLTYVPVPEPATMSLLAIGGIALIRRRRK